MTDLVQFVVGLLVGVPAVFLSTAGVVGFVKALRLGMREDQPDDLRLFFHTSVSLALMVLGGLLVVLAWMATGWVV